MLSTDGGTARQNLIGNATALIRATRGKGIVVSSEAYRALACRGPYDVINLAAVWGLGQEKGHESIDKQARAVVVQALMKRRSFRGVVDVVHGGGPTSMKWLGRGKKQPAAPEKGDYGKRKTVHLEDPNDGYSVVLDTDEESEQETVVGKKVEEAPISKREMKRRAKKAKLEAAANEGGMDVDDAAV